MSEDVRTHVDRAVETAIATDADLDEVETILRDAIERVEEVRVYRGSR